jgi:hypothetical protein
MCARAQVSRPTSSRAAGCGCCYAITKKFVRTFCDVVNMAPAAISVLTEVQPISIHIALAGV